MIYDVEVADYGSVACSSNKDEISSPPGRSVLEDLRMNCLQREILKEILIIFPLFNIPSISENVIFFLVPH
ncbi:unnamed protein product [Hymenolepis diminuta]|uniref:Uncharacterized protein n=1 Tax=Hymenolepis diminuta TaxID=6216 RepID=A0A564YNL0_HYMDI|nr:unnamed protein product [Hymenolepis diminuta]